MKDTDWSKVLQSQFRSEMLNALDKEVESLESTILTRVRPEDPDYNTVVEQATSGRYLLDLRRSGAFKVRGVKQGFKEDKIATDGPGVVYHNTWAHTAKLTSVRALLFRPNRGRRKLSLKDVKTAFLQANKYADGKVKYIYFRDPVTKGLVYYKQSGFFLVGKEV